jgi:hypothetical protein
MERHRLIRQLEALEMPSLQGDATYLMIVPPHWLGTPPPPQVWPVGHAPQSAVRPPHPSATCPQLALACWHVRGMQVVWHVPLLHVWFVAHWPQSAVRPPHPSAT